MGHTVGKGEIEDDCLDIGLNNGKTRVAMRLVVSSGEGRVGESVMELQVMVSVAQGEGLVLGDLIASL